MRPLHKLALHVAGSGALKLVSVIKLASFWK